MDTLIQIVTDNAVLFAIPFYFVLGFYILTLLGWFFSTDYYDAIYDWFDTNDDDFWLVHISCLFIIIVESIAIAVVGISDDVVLCINLVLWLVIILPVLLAQLIKVRKYLRKKRGKL